MSNSSSFPTPETYLNHFTPSQAARWESHRNVFLAVLGATLWDVLVYIPDDIKVLRKGIGIMTKLCFVFSRVFVVIFLILNVLMYTHPLPHCQGVDLSTSITSGFGVACFTFLFVRRVQAVYFDNKMVKWAFFGLWVLYLGTLVAAPFGFHARHRKHTNYCVSHDRKNPQLGSRIAPLIFDSLVFLAISYRIATSAHIGHGPRITWDTIISGKAVPRFSRAVLQSGQQYYLLTVTVNLANFIAQNIPEAEAYRTMFSPVCTALGASMACRVHRNITLFEYKSENTSLHPPSTVHFARNVISTQTADVGPKGSMQDYEGQINMEVMELSDKHLDFGEIGRQKLGGIP